ncbi:MAG: baeS [Herminiimonas sp.]|nr:baeS [Herminiimonas sp.]
MSRKNLLPTHSSAAALHERILESITDFAVVASDSEGRIIYWNAGAVRLLGWNHDEILGQPYSSFFPREGEGIDRPGPEQEPAVSMGRSKAERWYVGKNGERVWACAEVSPMKDERGQVTGFITILTGRTSGTPQSANGDNGLRELNEHLKQRIAERTIERNRLWNYSPDLIGFYTPQGLLTAVNPAFTAVLGYEQQELLGKSFRDFVHPEDLSSTEATVAASLASAQTCVTNRWRHKNGEYRWISWSANNDHNALFAIGRDVTAERAQSEALRNTELALRQAQKMEAAGQLTGSLAHDFNNMLAGISVNLEMLQIRIDQRRSPDVSRYITGALDVVNRAAGLTHRLLAFSRRQTLDPKPTDVNLLIRSMEEPLRRTLGSAVSLEVALATSLWTALCDVSQLENALLNLAVNSRDAMPEGGRLSMETSNVTLDKVITSADFGLEAGEYVCICVSDSGVGMEPQVLRHAVDPFFTTKPTGQGAGLGLSTVYGFATQSRGHLRLYSEPGKGTTVQLYLPRHLAEAPPDTVAERHADTPRAKRKSKVLLVEDETPIRDMSTEMLTDLGYNVFEASDGAEALAMLQSMPHVDLLITDVGLPGGMNGRQLADAARELYPGLKVLFITGFAAAAVVRDRMLDPGMQVMTKPFSMVSFANKVRSIIETNDGDVGDGG